VPPSRSTKKLPKAEIDALLKTEREKSGTRPALSESVIESFERAELRSAPTIPAPADLDDDFQLDLDPNRDPNDHDKP
jgi:hypothetical protein